MGFGSCPDNRHGSRDLEALCTVVLHGIPVVVVHGTVNKNIISYLSGITIVKIIRF